MSGAAAEIAEGQRFEFGQNWSRFLALLDDTRIEAAVQSLRAMLGVERLDGARFLDLGSGSGLFSLAARRLGARVHSFDYDPRSVACTRELKRRYFADDPAWVVEAGSVLDRNYLGSLGRFDVVYAWGVLHHTGALWNALDNVVGLVDEGGRLYVAIYNDQGGASRCWTMVKRIYNGSPRVVQWPLVLTVGAYFQARSALGRLTRLQSPSRRERSDDTVKATSRGMSAWYDLIDWVGGYPFEVAKPEQIFDFYRARGFELERLKTCGGGLGCNEYVFRKKGASG
jgi:2-polyprenyl-3-methyl-5-hydroxy-6-metoxy-1,4-benzoquinol methylase